MIRTTFHYKSSHLGPLDRRLVPLQTIHPYHDKVRRIKRSFGSLHQDIGKFHCHTFSRAPRGMGDLDLPHIYHRTGHDLMSTSFSMQVIMMQTGQTQHLTLSRMSRPFILPPQLLPRAYTTDRIISGSTRLNVCRHLRNEKLHLSSPIHFTRPAIDVVHRSHWASYPSFCF